MQKIKTSLKFRPNDTFGNIMVEHFQRRNSPLKCVHQYPTTEKHQERFLKHGWNYVYVKTIQDIWNRFVDTNEVAKLGWYYVSIKKLLITYVRFMSFGQGVESRNWC